MSGNRFLVKKQNQLSIAFYKQQESGDGRTHTVLASSSCASSTDSPKRSAVVRANSKNISEKSQA
jgi:hypothetical protein